MEAVQSKQRFFLTKMNASNLDGFPVYYSKISLRRKFHIDSRSSVVEVYTDEINNIKMAGRLCQTDI